MNPNVVLMQDNALGHATKLTIQEFNERSIFPIFWPAFSPNLNPIETLWNRMKDWIAWNYLNRKASYHQLRTQVIEAWQAIGEETLAELIATMPQRCRDVIAANGSHTKW